MNVSDVLKRIENKLQECGMTKEEFYAASGISSATFSNWNTGKFKPTVKKLRSAAQTLGVTYEYLLTGEEQQKKPAPEVGDEPKGYFDLTPDNRALIDAMIERLIKSQSDD